MSKRLVVVTVAFALLGGAFFSRGCWLTGLGYAVTVRPEEGRSVPRADAVLVPSADHVTKDMCVGVLEQAASLAETGSARFVFMTCTDWYGVSACELAQATLAERGHRIATRPVRMRQMPDSEEAELALAKLKESGVRAVAVLVPNYKTRRLGARYRQLAVRFGMDVRVVPSTCAGFEPRAWWKNRESRKLLAYELLRRVAAF